jgi:hypothetical protein
MGGDACIFRLEDAFSGYVSDSGETPASFRGVNQSVRHERTLHWLKLSGGTWKNGWYEDSAGMRRYTDVVSSAKAAPYFMMHRMFDMRTGLEVDCATQTDCESSPMPVYWGKQLSTETRPHNINSVYIANGTQHGLFIYEAEQVRVVRSVFDWQTLLSNLSLGLVLARWVLTLVSLHMGALRGKSVWFAGGIGCLAGAQSFFILPIASLPRMNMTLAVFWTVGCYFEGEQAALAEAWFAMYPGIALFVAVYFSLLNTLAKILRRRMYDGLFAPTLLGLCLLHYYRLELVNSGWLKAIDSRIPTLVFSDEVKKMQLADYFISDLAFRMNGRVDLIFGVKLGLLGINLLPLLLARPLPVLKRGSAAGLNGMEKALAVRAACVGGLGRSVLYLGDTKRSKSSVKAMILAAINGVRAAKTTDKADTVSGPVETPSAHQDGDSGKDEVEECSEVAPATDIQPSPRPAVLLNSYELIRLGYLVFGDQYVITFDEWDILSSMSLFRSFVHLWNHRVLVWRLRDAEKAGGRELESTEPQMWRLDDPRLLSIRMWQISACAVQC